VREHDRAVVVDRLAERDRVDSGDERFQLRATDLEREPAPVLAFKLQKVEGDEGRLLSSFPKDIIRGLSELRVMQLRLARCSTETMISSEGG
jgi:hypothetical protein